jgi:sec-independent protein translocase protein TatA
MLGEHWIYIILVLLLALVVFGPKRLPEVGSSLGRAIKEFRHAVHSVEAEGSSGREVGSGAPLKPPQSAGPELPSDTTV